MTKYESDRWKSIGGEASSTPDRPPKRNVTRKPIANIIGVSKLIWPRHIVPIHTKNFMPVGTAIRYDRKLKNGSSTWPVKNLWRVNTLLDTAPMSSVAAPSSL